MNTNNYIAQNQTEAPIGIGYLVLMEILLAIPVVGLIVALICSFTANTKSKKNYFRANLVILIIAYIIGILAIIGLAAAGELPFNQGSVVN